MEVYNLYINYYSKTNIEPEEFKLVGINDTKCINVKVNQNNETCYFAYNTKNSIEYSIFYEILNESPLWNYRWIVKLVSSNIFRFEIIIILDTLLINDFINNSLALNGLINIEYNKLEKFTKINDNISYLPYVQSFEAPESFKIKLYDYQKKSLSKMIKMENNELNYEIEYTKVFNFYNIDIIYDPITNLKSKEKKFKIYTNGGILSDEMGLGKTITSIALIQSNPSNLISTTKVVFSKKNNINKLYSKATIILCPSHLTTQWKNEITKCAPNLKILLILTKRDHEKLIFDDFLSNDIIITSHQFLMNFKYYPSLHYRYVTPASYQLCQRAFEILKHLKEKIYLNQTNISEELYNAIKQINTPIFEFFHFHRLILDEGHEIFGEMLGNQALSKYMSDWLNEIDVNYNWYISGSPFINFKGLQNCTKFINLRLIDEKNSLLLNYKDINDQIFTDLLNKNYIWNNILEKICIRHRNCDVLNEIKLFGYNEHIEWIEFTELEKQIYDSKKNKSSDYSLLQLCCHPFILDSNKRIFGDIDTDLSLMQTKLIEYHRKNVCSFEEKLNKLTEGNQSYYMLKNNFENHIRESKYMLNVLQKLEDTNLIEETDKNCGICLEDIKNNCGSITDCGHMFCSECIKTCLTYKKKCPMCNKNLNYNQVYTISKKIAPQENVNPLIQKYGSKLGKIISMIRCIVLLDTSRIIIFSQWDEMLSLIGKTLQENGIANCFVKGNVWAKNSAINKFKNGKNLSGEDNKVIMLSLKNCASGTNLTEATHIFFVEPINASKEECKAIEGQAIGRACRLGQKQQIEIYRFLIKNTIEEEIYKKVYKTNVVEI